MIELVLLVVMNRLANWGLAPIIVTRTVAADGAVLRELLSVPANQRRLLGTRRGADLNVKPSRSARVITTELRIGRRTVAWLTWILTGARGTTEVDLALQPESRGLATRLALVLGGRRWLARRLDAALATLARTTAHDVEHTVARSTSQGPPPAERTPHDEPLRAGGHAVVEHR